MKTFIATLIVSLSLLTLSGCFKHFKDGYQLGDVTRTYMDLKSDYCNATTDEQRTRIREKLKEQDPHNEPVCEQDRNDDSTAAEFFSSEKLGGSIS